MHVFEWMENNWYIKYYQVENIPTDRIIQMTLGTASHEILFHSRVGFQISKPTFLLGQSLPSLAYTNLHRLFDLICPHTTSRLASWTKPNTCLCHL